MEFRWVHLIFTSLIFFYADNALFLGEWDERNVRNLIQILTCFYMVYCLKINLSKCNLLGVGVAFDEVISLASFTRCSPLTSI